METITSLETIKSKLKSIIAQDLDINIDLAKIRDDVSLYEEGVGLDSISIVNFIILIENRFGIYFSETDLNHKMFSTLDNLADVISRKLA